MVRRRRAEQNQDDDDIDGGEQEIQKQPHRFIAPVLRVVDPEQGPDDRAAQRQQDSGAVAEPKGQKVRRPFRAHGDDEHAGETDENRENAGGPDTLAEQRNREQHQYQRPDEVDRLRFLGEQSRVRLKQDRVVQERVQEAQPGRPEVVAPCQCSQQSQPVRRAEIHKEDGRRRHRGGQ